jgi:hypothetical protein
MNRENDLWPMTDDAAEIAFSNPFHLVLFFFHSKMTKIRWKTFEFHSAIAPRRFVCVANQLNVEERRLEPLNFQLLDVDQIVLGVVEAFVSGAFSLRV